MFIYYLHSSDAIKMFEIMISLHFTTELMRRISVFLSSRLFDKAMGMNRTMQCLATSISWLITINQTCMAQMARMSQFGELHYVFVDIWRKFLRKCQNSQFFVGKCTNLVTLVETEFQCYQIAGLPDMNIFGQILAIFGFFSKNLGDNVPFLSCNSPNYDILAIWQKHVCLACTSLYKLVELHSD